MAPPGWIVRFAEIRHKDSRNGGVPIVQALIELLAGFIALLATAALAQFGVDLNAAPRPDREVHRVSDCPEAPTKALITAPRSNEC